LYSDETLNIHQRQCKVNFFQSRVITYQGIHTQIFTLNALFTKVDLLIIAIIIESLCLVKVFL